MRQLLASMILTFATGKYAVPLFVLNMLLLLASDVLLPLWLMRVVYRKTGKIRRIIVLPFFFLGWAIETVVLMFFFLPYNLSGFGCWGVFLLPIIPLAYARRFCGCPKKEKAEMPE